MPRYDIRHVSTQNTGSFVVADQFGANVLHSINTPDSGTYAPTAGFEDALINQGIHNLRYPGGHVENTLNVTVMPNGQLRPEVRDFLDWCVANSTDELKYEVTFVLPTKASISAQKIEDFVYRLLDQYGDTIVALEIGNEYSIGVEVDNPDRSIHPEHIEGSDFIAAMNEIEYGESANHVINAAQNALDRLGRESGGADAPNPHILLQMAETNGSASSYHGGVNTGNYDLANEAILSVLDDRALSAIDGAVVHYYYNVDRDNAPTFDDAVDWREIRRIDSRFENFEQHLGRDVELYITEWNVVAGNITQHGAASASILLEMFEFMVRLDVSDAHIWPLQHRSPNNIFGNRSAEQIESSMGGAAFSMMAESLGPRVSTTGHVDSFQSLVSNWEGREDGAVEINHFSSTYQDVLFLSLRSDSASRIGLNLGDITDLDSVLSIERLTIDTSSSDGLSDMADLDGQNRLRRRTISQEELDRLETLAFFDGSNANHVKISASGAITTYIPPFETIIALVSNPQGVDDYYFTSEVDVSPLRITLESPMSPNGDILLDVMPYDVVRITVDNVNHVSGDSTNNRLLGGVGRDSLLGRTGSDTLVGGEGNDTLKGGWDDDLLRAGQGNDLLVAGFGHDELHGGGGDDVLILTGGADIAFAEGGDDLIELQSIEKFEAGLNALHTLTARNGYENWAISIEDFYQYNTVIYGGYGTDQIQLGEGNDAFFLDDTYSSHHASLGEGAGARVIGVEIIHAGAGNDIVDLTSNSFRLEGSGIEIYGDAGNDTLWGANGSDSLFGGSGDDVLDGALGQDIFTGGAGADAFHFTEPEDVTHRITDFSVAQGDTIVLHLPTNTSLSGYSFDAQGAVLRIVDGARDVVLSVDVGGQAGSLASQSLAHADWFELA